MVGAQLEVYPAVSIQVWVKSWFRRSTVSPVSTFTLNGKGEYATLPLTVLSERVFAIFMAAPK